jgi:hypothetical protein
VTLPQPDPHQTDRACRRFNRESDEELRRRYAPHIGAAKRISRSDLERVANRWQLACVGPKVVGPIALPNI